MPQVLPFGHTRPPVEVVGGTVTQGQCLIGSGFLVIVNSVMATCYTLSFLAIGNFARILRRLAPNVHYW